MWAILWKFWMETGRFNLVGEAETQKEKKDLPFYGKSFFSFWSTRKVNFWGDKKPKASAVARGSAQAGFS